MYIMTDDHDLLDYKDFILEQEGAPTPEEIEEIDAIPKLQSKRKVTYEDDESEEEILNEENRAYKEYMYVRKIWPKWEYNAREQIVEPEGYDEDNVDEAPLVRFGVGSNAYRVMEYIWLSRNKGRKWIEIQKFIVEVLYDRDYTQAMRGQGASMLSGYNVGLLRNYCTKKEDGRWILSSELAKQHFSKSLVHTMSKDKDVQDALIDLLP